MLGRECYVSVPSKQQPDLSLVRAAGATDVWSAELKMNTF